jgi:alpha-L-arabinofuranosidase
MAIAQRGLPAGNLGWREHGITTTSQFEWNDMTGAIHWAAWLSETMRLNTQWDSIWCLGSEGYSTAMIQVRDGIIIRPPVYYVYQMAMAMRGMIYVDTEYTSHMGSCYWLPNDYQSTAQFPWLVIRALKDAATGRLSLFVINQDPARSFRITGLESHLISGWSQVSGTSYTDGDPFGPYHTLNPFPTVPVHRGPVQKDPSAPLVFDPISISRVDFQ